MIDCKRCLISKESVSRYQWLISAGWSQCFLVPEKNSEQKQIIFVIVFLLIFIVLNVLTHSFITIRPVMCPYLG